MIRVAVVGFGKMGASHHAIINSHPDVKVAAICDSTAYILDVLTKYTNVAGFTDFTKMLDELPLDAVIIATPSSSHAALVEQALNRNLHVFCEKPFCLDAADAERLSALAAERGLVNQVGYHNRFVGAFQEVKRLVDGGAIGKITHVLAEAYGPVVLKPKGSTWRTQRTEGGGCLYDYAAHPINLLNWFFGSPTAVGGSVLNKIFSRDTDDEVYSTLFFNDGMSAQISVNWSDDSYRKMTTKISIWGTNGRIYADRQECQVYLRDATKAPDGYEDGWNVKYTTDLTEEVWFYLRGEEYSAQLDYFVTSIGERRVDNVNSFASAAQTDDVIAMIVADSDRGPNLGERGSVRAAKPKKFAFFKF